jgi:hypothetical protein
MRYVSAERAIAAAGAAFAFSDDEPRLATFTTRQPMGRFKAMVWRALLVSGLIVV